jgi:hypothetical protein
VKEFGFGRGAGQFDNGQVGWAVLMENTSKTQAAENVRLQISFLDATGGIVKTENGSMPILLPGQTTAFGGTTYLQDKTVDMQTMQVQVLARDWNTTEITQSFSAEGAAYRADRYSPKVAGFVVSPFTKDIQNVYVTAVARDEAGMIIGGGFTFLQFVPAAGKSAVEVSVTTSAAPTTVELYPTFSHLSLLNQ